MFNLTLFSEQIKNTNSERKEKNMSKDWWILLLKKIIETCISVKVLTITAILIISTYLVLHGFMSGGEWGAVNGGIIATVFALREGMKIAKVKSKGINNTEKNKEENKEEIFV